jgi:prepilin-type N-terminal cleavage/methylation domain-containing protein
MPSVDPLLDHCMKNGFTLIELLVTLTILGVLMSTALPQYERYRKRGYDIQAEMDLRNVAIAEEAYYLDNEQYLPCQNDQCNELPGISKLSKGVELSIETTNEDSLFTGRSTHKRGTGKQYLWNSESGMEGD